MMDLLDYSTSPLNPALKIIIFLLFAAVFIIYLDTRRNFGGGVRSLVDLLSLSAFFMMLGAFFRIFGDGLEFGFSADFSLKWLQSTAYLAAAICYVLAAHRLLTLFTGGRS